MDIKIPAKISLAEQATGNSTFRGVLLAGVSAVSSEIVLGSLNAGGGYLKSVTRIAVLFVALYVIHRFSFSCLRTYRPAFKDICTLTLVILGSVVIIGLSKVIGISLIAYFASSSYLGNVSAQALSFAIPFASGAILIQAIFGMHYGIVFALSMTAITAVYSPDQPLFVPYVLTSCLLASLSISKFRSRSAYTRAGFNIVVITLPFAFASLLLNNASDPYDIAAHVLSAFLNGALCSSIASGITPIFEFLGKYVTDMRLIEMATLDHELLKELSIQAPGTWNHSMVMGMMVESAASSIGANSVISRVGAYFHDIGKMKKPLYFVENQIPGENRHDKLSPSMSALIIRSHVKDGIELAKKHKLPLIIQDMIAQHHGTSFIEYFYDKACKEARESEEGTGEVDKSLYTYPGPRPQTKEAGILMLADGIEAAARTISDPTPDRIQGLVQKMINKVFASGELDECELTLKDLHAIAKCFTRVLAGIYHQRIAYAEPAEKITEKASAKGGEESKQETAAPAEVAGTGSVKKQKTQSEDKSDKEDSKEDLKRLGLQP